MNILILIEMYSRMLIYMYKGMTKHNTLHIAAFAHDLDIWPKKSKSINA